MTRRELFALCLAPIVWKEGVKPHTIYDYPIDYWLECAVEHIPVRFRHWTEEEISESEFMSFVSRDDK